MKNTRAIEYKMSRAMFDHLLTTRTEGEKKLNPYTFVMGVLNERFGLRGEVKRVLIEED